MLVGRLYASPVDRWFMCRSRAVSAVKRYMFDGMVPIKEFELASNLIKFVIVTIVEGIVPLSLLLSSMNDFRDFIFDTSVEMLPDIEFDPRYIPVSPLIE